MTTQEINQLRKDGKLYEAYSEAQVLLSQYPDDKYIRITMAWCLKSLCEQYSKVKNVDDFTEKLQELAYLRLDEIGIDDMANRFTWDIKILFELLMNEPDILLETAERILTIIPNLNFQRPHKYYSLLADTFMRVKGRQNTAWLHFVDFMEWFCFDNFLPEDYERIHLKNGKSLPSIVERVYNAYYKALMAQIEAGNVHLQRIDDFIKRLTRLNEKHPEYQYTLYHKALLLLVLNKKTEALDSLRPFVKRKQNDFWVWDVLSETVDDSNLKLSCLCRALMCHTEPKFLGRIHLKAAHLMHALGFDGNARTEIRAINKTYQEQGWNMPREAIEIVQQDWYQAAVAPESNINFYKEHLDDSEHLLYINEPEIPILITRYNHEKRVCNFVTSDKKTGFFFTKGLRVRFFDNCIYHVRVEGGIQPNNPTKILTCTKIDDVTPYVGTFVKKIDGVFKIKPNQQFGFVDDIYVHPDLINENMTNGVSVVGTAVQSFDTKKGTWGWRAISLKLKNS